MILMNRMRIMLLPVILHPFVEESDAWERICGGRTGVSRRAVAHFFRFSESAGRAFRIFFPQRKRPADFFVVSDSAYGMKLCPWRILSKNFFFRACRRLGGCAQAFQFFLRKAFGPEGDVH